MVHGKCDSVFLMAGIKAIAVVKARPFEIPTILNLTFQKSRFQMLEFKIPTVFGY